MIVQAVVFDVSPEGRIEFRHEYMFKSAQDLKEWWRDVTESDRAFPNRLKSQAVFLVNRTRPTAKPPAWVSEEGGHWCPYCAGERYFPYSSSLGVHQCFVCGISSSDYYVRRMNNLPE